MGLKERRAREKERLRQEILDAARDLFVAEGYERVSMRRIAEKIDYSPTTIYLYFKDKSELLFSICQETFTKLAARLEKVATESADPLVSLKKGCRAYVDFGLKHPNHYRVTFGAHPEARQGREPYLREGSMGLQAFNYLRLGVARCVERNLFRETDVELISQALWAAMHGITTLLITKPDFPWGNRHKLIDLVIDTMIEGLKA
jgi:AcrR family transcriptional regulator